MLNISMILSSFILSRAMYNDANVPTLPLPSLSKRNQYYCISLRERDLDRRTPYAIWQRSAVFHIFKKRFRVFERKF